MDFQQQFNDIIIQATDKNVRVVLLQMTNNLLSGKNDLTEKVSDLQTICYNLNEWLRV